MPWTTSGSSSLPTMPRRGAWPSVDVGDVARPGRACPCCSAMTMSLDVVEAAGCRPDAPDVEACSPRAEPLPPTFWLAFGDGRDDLGEGDAVPAQPVGVDLHVVLLGLAAVARDVDDARHLLELPLQDPVLGGLQVAPACSPCPRPVAEELADGVPGRELAAAALRAAETNWSRLMTSCRACFVVGAPLEVALDVAQPEEGLRADVVQARHAGQADLQRDGHVALDLLGAPAVGLGDDLDHRRHRVGVGLDVELAVGVDPGDNTMARATIRTAAGIRRTRSISRWIIRLSRGGGEEEGAAGDDHITLGQAAAGPGRRCAPAARRSSPPGARIGRCCWARLRFVRRPASARPGGPRRSV